MSPASSSADVLVVGAGMSGIATAWSLRQLGVSSIVLEARPDRIGGRIWSSYKWGKDTPVDLGASWVTHMTVNTLVDLARSQKPPIELAPSELLNLALTEADGTQLSDDETVETMLRYFSLLGAVKASAARREKSGKPDVAVSGEIARALKAMNLPEQKRRNVEFFINYQIAEPCAANLDDLSLYHWDDDYVQTMLAIAVVPGGYVKIAEALAKKLDIRRGHVVCHIGQTKDGVTVTTKDHGELRAPYAVVTLPHGVLAKGHVKFSPPLPEWKCEAIRRIHTGLSDKFFFLFPRVFWNTKRDSRGRVDERDILGRVDEKENGHWSTWVNFHLYTKKPILMCFNRTDHAIALEKMSDQDVVDEAMKVLRAEFPGQKVPEPLKMQRSHWHCDPFAEGTLPHVPPGATSEDYRTLAKPVGRLRFAGDSTHTDFTGTVLGAFLSGIRESEKLATLLYGNLVKRILGG